MYEHDFLEDIILSDSPENIYWGFSKATTTVYCGNEPSYRILKNFGYETMIHGDTCYFEFNF